VASIRDAQQAITHTRLTLNVSALHITMAGRCLLLPSAVLAGLFFVFVIALGGVNRIRAAAWGFILGLGVIAYIAMPVIWGHG
jgi:hypothetical protein